MATPGEPNQPGGSPKVAWRLVKIPEWRIDGFGYTVLFPSHKGFEFHSRVVHGNLISHAWNAPLSSGQSDKAYFSAGLIKIPPNLPAEALGRVVDYSSNREAQRCLGHYERAPLFEPSSDKRAEVTSCVLKDGPLNREVAVHVYFLDSAVMYMAHWVETLPTADTFSLTDARWIHRLASMVPVVVCKEGTKRYGIPEDCMNKLLRAPARPSSELLN